MQQISEHLTAKMVDNIKYKIIVSLLAIALLVITGIVFAQQKGLAEQERLVEQERLAAEREIVSEAEKMLAVGYLSVWEDEASYTFRTDYPRWITLLRINEEYELCYIRKNGVYNCVVLRTADNHVSSAFEWNGQLFARDLGVEEYGLIFEDGMIVFSRTTLLPLRLEPTPALRPTDFVDPSYLKEWRLQDEIGKGKQIYMINNRVDRIGAYQLDYLARYKGSALDSEITYLLFDDNGEKQSYTPLLTISDTNIRTGYLFDGHFAIMEEKQGWVLTLDQETGEPVSLHWNLEETGSELWYPLASTPYNDGKVTVGYLLSPGLEGRIAAICIYDANGAVLRSYNTEMHYNVPEKRYNIKIPELRTYGDHLIFTNADWYGGILPVSMSLLDGSYETAKEAQQLFLGQENAITLVRVGSEFELACSIQVWKEGKRHESFDITIPKELLPADIWQLTISDVVYDEANRQIFLYSPADQYTINVDTSEITVTECLPAEPEYVIGTTEDGRYTVGYVALSPKMDNIYCRIYRIDNHTGEARTLFERMLNWYDGMTVIRNQLAVSNQNTIFYNLETCELLPVSLPSIEGGIHDVVFDEETGFYFRAISPAAENYNTETLTTRIECFDGSGNFVRGWDTDCKPAFGKYAVAEPIQLAVYHREALFYDCANESRSLARLNLATGEILKTEARDFAISNGYLYTAEYFTKRNETNGESTPQVTMRKYLGDTLVEEKTVRPVYNYFEDFIVG